MKRSAVNAAIDWAMELLEKENWKLPEYAYWTAEDWKKNRDKTETIRKVMLGWDVSDYGINDFDNLGGVLYTIRNGTLDKTYGVPYAEKLLIFHPGQHLPTHFHYTKTEDIIVRSGIMRIKLYNSTPEGEVDPTTPVQVYMDGIRYTIEAGKEFELKKGQSISLTPGLYHTFGSTETEILLAGEVSSINDDNIDNHFSPDMPRYVPIDEDEPIRHVLCNEYDAI